VHAPPRGLAVRPPRRLIVSFALFPLIALGGLALAIFGHGFVDRAVGSILFVLVGLVLFGGISKRIWRREPLFEVTSGGLEHPDLGVIRWDEIDRLVIRNGTYGRRLDIEVVDPRAFLRRYRTRTGRVLGHLNLIAGWPLFSLTEYATGLRPEYLRARIEQMAGRTFPG
jgi:hypothetical protein